MKRNLNNITKLLEARLQHVSNMEQKYAKLHKGDLQEVNKRMRWLLEDIIEEISDPKKFNASCAFHRVEEDK